jgi:hypothetical protein
LASRCPLDLEILNANFRWRSARTGFAGKATTRQPTKRGNILAGAADECVVATEIT